MFQLRLDIAELKALEAQASRPKVQEILSLEVRKLETLLVQKTEQSSIPVTATNQTGKTPVVSNTPRSYEIQLTNYGMLTRVGFKFFAPSTEIFV